MQMFLLTIDALCVVLITVIYLTRYTEKKVKKHLNKHRLQIDKIK
jgi:hypothetical protein